MLVVFERFLKCCVMRNFKCKYCCILSDNSNKSIICLYVLRVYIFTAKSVNNAVV